MTARRVRFPCRRRAAFAKGLPDFAAFNVRVSFENGLLMRLDPEIFGRQTSQKESRCYVVLHVVGVIKKLLKLPIFGKPGKKQPRLVDKADVKHIHSPGFE